MSFPASSMDQRDFARRRSPAPHALLVAAPPTGAVQFRWEQSAPPLATMFHVPDATCAAVLSYGRAVHTT